MNEPTPAHHLRAEPTGPKPVTRTPRNAPHRVLIVDDNPEIHEDFRQVFEQEPGREDLDALLLSVLGTQSPPSAPRASFDLSFATQGQQALEMVVSAQKAGDPFALVFMDIQMPPGWNGVESTKRITAVDPDVHIVLCTAYTDRAAQQEVTELPARDRILILKKPFDVIEVQQLANALCDKWILARRDRARMAELEHSVSEQRGELAATNAHLRKEIAERAHAEDQLRKAQRLEGLGRLAAGLGHEINNPLSFVVGNAQILQQEIESLVSHVPQHQHESLLEMVESIAIGANRIANIVRNIKLFARQRETKTEVIPLADAIASAVRMARLQQHERIDVVVEVGEQQVVGHRLEFEQVLINLLENASHAMASTADRPHRLQLQVDEPNDRVIALHISDTGPGIDAAIIDKIFDPFFTTKSVDKGTGLGLSICHSLIQSMGGTISVQSTPGQGTRFTVTLPAEAPAPRPKPAAKPVRTHPSTPPRGGRILAIDDEPIILRIIRRILRGYSVTCVSNAPEALELCAQEPFDVILCDIMMPGTSGCDFHGMLAEQSPGAEQSVVFITGGALMEGVRNFLAQVPNPCLEKPFEAEELRTIIEQTMHEAAAERVSERR